MHLDLRIASKSDAVEITGLVNRAYRPQLPERGWTHESDLVAGDRTTPDQIIALFAPQSLVLVLCHDDTVVACVHLQSDGPYVYIGMLATEPSHQKLGLGKQMLLHAEKYAKAHFKPTAFRMSVLSSRVELIAFYERRGYVRNNDVKDYPVSAGVGQPLVEGLQVATMIKNVG